MRSTIIRRIWPSALAVGALLTFSSHAFADIVVSVTDSLTPASRGSVFIGGQYSNVIATSFTLATALSGVAIDASLVSDDSSFLGGTAYLTNAIGPGATPASVVAQASFTAPFGNPSGSVPLTTLFSGLSLSSGSYYLVLSAPFLAGASGSPLDWQIPTNPVITTSPSATLGSAFGANTFLTTVDPFPPASSFFTTQTPMFDVTAVPEPSTIVLLLVPVTMLILIRKRITRSRRTSS